MDDFQLGCHSCHATPRNNLRRSVFAIGNRGQEEAVRLEWMLGRLRHLHGPRLPQVGRHELMVLCIGRDAAVWIRDFIEHHLGIGAAHIVYLDNGSQDDTVSLASRYDRVSVFATALPFGHFEVGMRRWLTRRFAAGRWSLYCDADELFDYPCSDRLSLVDFLRYLEHYRYTAVTGQMLDLFSDRSFSDLAARPAASLTETYRFYDLSDLIATREVYWIRNGQLDSPVIACHFGGIRKRFFGDACLLLTKHPLVFADRRVGLYTYDGHFMTGAAVADISTVLRHYKYVAGLPERARSSADQVNPELYRGLSTVLADRPDLCLRLDTARELGDTSELVDAGFLVVTERYLDWVKRYGR